MKVQNVSHVFSCLFFTLLFLAITPSPAMAECSFDSMALLGNGKVYVTKGNQYVRFSGAGSTKMDEGYPQPITGGNWGGEDFIQWVCATHN